MTTMRHWLAVFALVGLTTAAVALSAEQGPLLLRYPAANRTHLVFTYANDLWVVPRAGGEATRLTAGNGNAALPSISPDGTTVAFTGDYDGNRDVFVVPIAGGIPRRLTSHPTDELVRGWSPDGHAVLYASAANSFYHDETQLYTVNTTGGFPESLPVPSATEASFSPDGTHLAAGNDNGDMVVIDLRR
jgi:tricorn protease